MSPTARTLALFRKRGYQAGIVEKWIPQTKRRLDLFGFIDIVAVGNGEIAGIQATAQSSNHAHRERKILEDPDVKDAALAWVQNGGIIYVVSWRKKARKMIHRISQAAFPIRNGKVRHNQLVFHSYEFLETNEA